MSTLVVKVTAIDEVKPHPNADRLDLTTVGGWQCVVPKGQYAAGERVVYFPPDTVLPQSWTDRFGVTQYASRIKDAETPLYRIRCAKLRGEPSFGLVVKAAEYLPDAAEGDDAASFFEATKYEPPVRTNAGDVAADHALFPKYTDIENLRNYSDVFEGGETVFVTEKIHGTNCRVGICEGEWMAGSKALRRKRPGGTPEGDTAAGEDGLKPLASNTYWFPWTLEPVRALLTSLAEKHGQVVLYGEVYGRGVQSFDYGQKGIGFRAFDLLVDGRFLNPTEFDRATQQYGVESVPWLGSGPYSQEWVAELSKGRSTIGGQHVREGVVVRPAEERHDPRVGRVVLKYPSDAYLLGLTEDFTDQ
jgi:RNA ligase (TIGR02306 family)